MRTPHRLALFLALFLLSAGCAGEEAPMEALLGDYDFTTAGRAMVFPDDPVYEPALYWFAGGWGRSDNGLFWFRGSDALLYHYLVGSKVTFALDCGALKKGTGTGLKLTVSVNGGDAAAFTFREETRIQKCIFTIPDTFLKQGLNVLRFQVAAADAAPPGGGSGKGGSTNLFLKGLKIRARLDGKQRAKWRDLKEAKRPEPGWELVRGDASSSGGGSSSRGGAYNRSALPDVLMILLDAARPDHFGCYGYARDTTPCIDRLATDGIVLRNAFASSPYTLCSVPTILTGRSWLEHGVVTGKQALAGSFITLAEALKGAGYFTLAVSANACFSSVYHSQQGFDEFIESWRVQRKEGLAAEFPEEYLARRLEKGLGPKPAFIYLHLLPPHQPYVPGPAHDLFSDPEYRGPADGGNEIIKAYDLHKRSWSEADRRHLIDLYDGNLHRIDASVGRILASFRRLNRGRDLLAIVFSDHGEAFGEHGRFSHNSTVYDEMVRVPLIFHPARLVPSLSGREEAFFCLSDLMPLLLHVIKAPLPPGASWPRRFLDVYEDPGRERSAVVLRNYANLVGLRTPRFLALVDGWKHQELYDLVADPGAAENLRLREPDRYAGMIARLEALLDLRGVGEAAVEARLSKEAIENLKALGYMH